MLLLIINVCEPIQNFGWRGSPTPAEPRPTVSAMASIENSSGSLQDGSIYLRTSCPPRGAPLF